MGTRFRENCIEKPLRYHESLSLLGKPRERSIHYIMAKCRLCEDTRELQNSHIIPRFVIRWMKKTGPTPFLRKVVDPDTRIQDHHEKPLCKDCEQTLSNWEGKFAAQVFYPHVREEKKEFEYDEWLYKFVLSVSWRLLVSEKIGRAHV